MARKMLVEKLSICLCYEDNAFVPQETSVGLYEPPTTKGSTITACVKDVLVRLQLSLSSLRGQMCDGASSTSGYYIVII